MELYTSCVNDALAQGLRHLRLHGIKESSRNGDVLVAPSPVMTTYMSPEKRVVFSPTRDANPFFHIMECLWMIAGRNDLAWPKTFNSRFGAYSDDGVTIHGAYGHRWINHFEFNQLWEILAILKKDPFSRRAVLTMWDPKVDLDVDAGADVPCNTQAFFDCRGGKLNMTVVNRSNDAVWGAYGANAVHFSFLLEFMAGALGVKMGVYRQFSNNLHAYTDIFSEEKLEIIEHESAPLDQYHMIRHVPIMDIPLDLWMEEVVRFLENPDEFDNSPSNFLQNVVRPMYQCWMERVTGKGDGMYWVNLIVAEDWKRASKMWVEKRNAKLAGAK